MASRDKIKVQINPVQVAPRRGEETASKLFARNLRQIHEGRNRTIE